MNPNLHDGLRERHVVLRDSSVSDESNDSVRNRSQQEGAGASGDILLLLSGEDRGERRVSSDGVTHPSFLLSPPSELAAHLDDQQLR